MIFSCFFFFLRIVDFESATHRYALIYLFVMGELSFSHISLLVPIRPRKISVNCAKDIKDRLLLDGQILISPKTLLQY